ncbi:MAG: metal ABC transporter permease [Candidatus Ozemobacteraceae bacterium]
MLESPISMIQTVLDIYGYAFPVGLIIAASGALFGVFVVLKRVVFIGITLSEAAACGIALGLILEWHPFWGAFLTAMVVVVLLGMPFEQWFKLPRDTLLGVLFVAFSGGSVVLVAKSGFGLEKVQTLLFGSLLFASSQDLWVIVAVLFPCTAWLLISLRPTTYAFLDPDAALVLGVRVRLMELAFFIALGAVVAAASKIAGVLLIFCYLVVAPGVALLLYHRLHGVLVLAVAVAWVATIGGILVSYRFDLPPNQTVGLWHCLLFLLAVLGRSGIPVIRWKNGAPFVLISTVGLLLWMLTTPFGMSREGAIQNSSSAVSPTANAVLNIPSQPSTTQPEATTWPEQSQNIIQTLRNDKKIGVTVALEFLRQDPPLLFRAQVVSSIEKTLIASCGWNIHLPASDPCNLKAGSECVKHAFATENH